MWVVFSELKLQRKWIPPLTKGQLYKGKSHGERGEKEICRLFSDISFPSPYFLFSTFIFHNSLILGCIFLELGMICQPTPLPLVHSKTLLASIWRAELSPCLLELCHSVVRAETSTLLSHFKWDQEEKDDLKHRWINFSGHCTQWRWEPSYGLWSRWQDWR